MSALDAYKVRFGDLSFGPLLHHTKFFDLLCRAIEEFTSHLDRTTEDIVSASGVPYAPIAVDGEILRYPTYEETVELFGRSIAYSDASFQVQYDLRRQSDGAPVANARIVHVTLDSEGEVVPLSSAAKRRLSLLGRNVEAESPPVLDLFRTEISSDRDGSTFSREVVFRSPHMEAADLGYFEDYFRLARVAFEDYLEEQEASLRELSGPTYPFNPFRFGIAFERSIEFQDTIRIEGKITGDGDGVTTHRYNFVGTEDGELRIRSEFHCGCFDETGTKIDCRGPVRRLFTPENDFP